MSKYSVYLFHIALALLFAIKLPQDALTFFALIIYTSFVMVAFLLDILNIKIELRKKEEPILINSHHWNRR